MDLKFTFGGASPDQHDHGGAPSGVSPLPLSAKPVSLGPTSTVLDVVLRRADGELIAEALSGDGVTYGRAPVTDAPAAEDAAFARALRSALSRVIAELDSPLSESVTALVLDLGDDNAAALAALGLDAAAPVVDAALQRRAGIAMGTPVRLGA